MSRALAIATLSISLLSFGCGGVSIASVAGKYQGQMIATADQGNLASGLQRGLASSMSLELKQDKTFHLVAMIVPVDGTWSLEGNTVTLTPNKVLGFNKSDIGFATDKPTKFTVSAEKLEPESDAGGSRFRFVKERVDATP